MAVLRATGLTVLVGFAVGLSVSLVAPAEASAAPSYTIVTRD